jgi:hypothetical protein
MLEPLEKYLARGRRRLAQNIAFERRWAAEKRKATAARIDARELAGGTVSLPRRRK